MKIQPFSTINPTSPTENITTTNNTPTSNLNLLDKIAPLLNNVEKLSNFFNIPKQQNSPFEIKTPSNIPPFDDDLSPQSLTNPSPLSHIHENQSIQQKTSPNILNNILGKFLNFGNQTEPNQNEYTPPAQTPSPSNNSPIHPWQKQVNERQLYRNMLIHQEKLNKLRK